MNKYFIFIFILILPFIAFSQEKKDQTIAVGIGKPWNPNVYKNRKNLNFSLHYQNEFSEIFSYEAFVQYAKTNSFPEFHNNEQQLDTYLKAQGRFEVIYNSYWEKTNIFSAGGKLHYSFVNNPKFFFSFYVGAGVFRSYSKIFLITFTESDPVTQKITDYEYETPEETYIGLFYMPGIHFNYNFYKDFTIGLDFNLHRMFDAETILPVTADFYGASIVIGKKF